MSQKGRGVEARHTLGSKQNIFNCSHKVYITSYKIVFISYLKMFTLLPHKFYDLKFTEKCPDILRNVPLGRGRSRPMSIFSNYCHCHPIVNPNAKFHDIKFFFSAFITKFQKKIVLLRVECNKFQFKINCLNYNQNKTSIQWTPGSQDYLSKTKKILDKNDF